MNFHLVSGGCGFVGRNMVKRLWKTTSDTIIFIDDLSVGTHPFDWIAESGSIVNGATHYDNGRLIFIEQDFRETLRCLEKDENYFKVHFGIPVTTFSDVYHFAAVVGGRAKIDGDPMKVAIDLAIDAEFFNWVCRHKPSRVLYPSSSVAYPIDLQTESDAIALSESDIDFKKMGEPDMTYGWAKLTGEYLAKIAASHYGVSITCIRPFSGYGEDQDLTYPIPAIARRAALKEDPFEVWGSGNQGRDFVHIDDVLDCIEVAMNHIKDGTAINIGMGRLSSFREIIEIFCRFAGYSPTIQPLLDKPVGVHSRYCDMSFVKKTLNWEAKISLEEGLRRVYDATLNKIN